MGVYRFRRACAGMNAPLSSASHGTQTEGQSPLVPAVTMPGGNHGPEVCLHVTVLPDLELLSDGAVVLLGLVRLTESCCRVLDSVLGACPSGAHAAVTGVCVVSRCAVTMDAWASGILAQAGGCWGYA